MSGSVGTDKGLPNGWPHQYPGPPGPNGVEVFEEYRQPASLTCAYCERTMSSSKFPLQNFHMCKWCGDIELSRRYMRRMLKFGLVVLTMMFVACILQVYLLLKSHG